MLNILLSNKRIAILYLNKKGESKTLYGMKMFSGNNNQVACFFLCFTVYYEKVCTSLNVQTLLKVVVVNLIRNGLAWF